MPPITIPINRKRLPYAAIVFSYVTGVFIFWTVKGEMDGVPMDAFGRLIWALVSICWFLWVFLTWADWLYTSFSKNAAVNILEDGIDERSSIFSLGEIPWQDVHELTVIQRLRINLLIVYLYNPKKYIAAQPTWKRLVLSRWLKRFGSPVVISQRRITHNVHELKDILENRIASSPNLIR
jgi:hypothetical protein